ncbi:tubulin polyglutamylase TTLL6-like [Tachypleus tridentatus]|uniref:tubulin polyglutamylase TTLL6-like n=1 Tax=Tachypleus tridentatus TaxID=6853 RepID=UPI003FD3E729
MQEVGFEQVTEQEQWHIFWTDLPLSLDRVVKMKIFQKINHFPGMTEICRKDFLARNLNRMCKQFPKDYKFFSRTWLLPSELLQLYVYLNTHRNSVFIIKPENNCQGRGIYLVKDVSELGVQSRGICQQYIKKKKLRMHLTNYSINKTSENFKQDAEHGNKRKISTVMRYLQSNGYDVSTVWTNIDDAVIKTLLSALPVLQYNYKAYFPSHELLTSPCFEILGFDVLLNYKLKPYILEVNHSPSYNTDSSVDKEVKESLLRDSLKLLTITCHACKETQTSMLKKTPCGILPFDQRKFRREPVVHTKKCQDQHELENLGGFRQVFPSGNNKYTKFYPQKSSTHTRDTIASKMRALCIKEQLEKLCGQEFPRLRPPPTKKSISN